jgi:hypothetical protein
MSQKRFTFSGGLLTDWSIDRIETPEVEQLELTHIKMGPDLGPTLLIVLLLGFSPVGFPESRSL